MGARLCVAASAYHFGFGAFNNNRDATRTQNQGPGCYGPSSQQPSARSSAIR